MNKVLIIIVLILSLVYLSSSNLPKLVKNNKELLQGFLSAGLVTMFLHKPLIENLPTGEGANSCAEIEPSICGTTGTFDSTFSYNTLPEIGCCGARCVETATTSVAADAALCAAVTGEALNDSTACDAVRTTAHSAIAACTYNAAPDPAEDPPASAAEEEPPEEEPPEEEPPEGEPPTVVEPSNNSTCESWLENNQCSNGLEPEPDSLDMYEPDSEEPEDVCCKLSWKGIGLYIFISLGIFFAIERVWQAFQFPKPIVGLLVTFIYAIILIIVGYYYNINYKYTLAVIFLGSVYVSLQIYSRTQEKGYKQNKESAANQQAKDVIMVDKYSNRRKKEKRESDKNLLKKAPRGVKVSIGGETVDRRNSGDR